MTGYLHAMAYLPPLLTPKAYFAFGPEMNHFLVFHQDPP